METEGASCSDHHFLVLCLRRRGHRPLPRGKCCQIVIVGRRAAPAPEGERSQDRCRARPRADWLLFFSASTLATERPSRQFLTPLRVLYISSWNAQRWLRANTLPGCCHCVSPPPHMADNSKYPFASTFCGGSHTADTTHTQDDGHRGPVVLPLHKLPIKRPQNCSRTLTPICPPHVAYLPRGVVIGAAFPKQCRAHVRAMFSSRVDSAERMKGAFELRFCVVYHEDVCWAQQHQCSDERRRGWLKSPAGWLCCAHRHPCDLCSEYWLGPSTAVRRVRVKLLCSRSGRGRP